MRIQLRRPVQLFAVVAVSSIAALAGCTSTHVATSASIVSPPASGWLQYAAPESAGFSSAALDKAFRYADSVRSGAVMVVYRGTVIAAWGDVARKLDQGVRGSAGQEEKTAAIGRAHQRRSMPL